MFLQKILSFKRIPMQGKSSTVSMAVNVIRCGNQLHLWVITIFCRVINSSVHCGAHLAGEKYKQWCRDSPKIKFCPICFKQNNTEVELRRKNARGDQIVIFLRDNKTIMPKGQHGHIEKTNMGFILRIHQQRTGMDYYCSRSTLFSF